MSVHIKASTDGTRAIIGVNGGDQFSISSTGNVEINGKINLNDGLDNVGVGDNVLVNNTTGDINTAVGICALQNNTTGYHNTVVGVSALQENTIGNYNTAFGAQSLKSYKPSNNYNGVGSNAAFGTQSLRDHVVGEYNTAIGGNALRKSLSAAFCTAVGFNALEFSSSHTNNIRNVAIGGSALANHDFGNNNTAVGHGALFGSDTSPMSASHNTAVGHQSMVSNEIGNYNTAVGQYSLRENRTGDNNTVVGQQSMYANLSGNFNTAIGVNALYYNLSSSNTGIGHQALQNNTVGDVNTALGRNALLNNVTWRNTTGLGYDAQVTGSNQVQLGDSATTTYAYGAVQNRSDARDKTDIRDTELGLEFISALRPVDFKWDLREDYRPEAPERVEQPLEPSEDASEEEKAQYQKDLEAYNAYKVVLEKHLEDSKLSNIAPDGSKKRNRYHHGLIAQEVKAVLDSKGIDFGGFQDHSVKGGDDVLSIGYNELIAPLIKAVQELSEQNKQLESRLQALENK